MLKWNDAEPCLYHSLQMVQNLYCDPVAIPLLRITGLRSSSTVFFLEHM